MCPRALSWCTPAKGDCSTRRLALDGVYWNKFIVFMRFIFAKPSSDAAVIWRSRKAVLSRIMISELCNEIRMLSKWFEWFNKIHLRSADWSNGVSSYCVSGWSEPTAAYCCRSETAAGETATKGLPTRKLPKRPDSLLVAKIKGAWKQDKIFLRRTFRLSSRSTLLALEKRPLLKGKWAD